MKNLLLPIVITAIANTTLAAPGTGTRPLALPTPVTDADYRADASPAKVELGRMLFFDKVLSGNRNISCATCHHPTLGTSDAMALSFGEGARGLGLDRRPGATASEAVHERVPRNSPALFNLGAREYTTMFHDGRVEEDDQGFYEGGFITPAKWKLPRGLDNVLAAQAMFPVTSPTEMAGQQGENEIANAKAANKAGGPEGVWELLAQRLRGIPEYVALFREAYPGEVESAGDVTFVRAANAIAAFEATAFRSDDSPFDRHLRGEGELDAAARRGMELFYGKASCTDCHAGKFQTDHGFHAIAMPQIGPGKSDGWDSGYWSTTGQKAFPEDHGRGRVTARAEDRYRFRTPSLRNVELTGPWGHAGSYSTLEDVLRHHVDPVRSLEEYDAGEAPLAPLERVLEITADGSELRQSWLSPKRFEGFRKRDTWVQTNPTLRAAIAGANELEPVALTDGEVGDLVAFLESLTDPRARDLSNEVPGSVPSGLPVED